MTGPICRPERLTMADRVNSPRVVNIADLRRLAKRRLPRVAFDYIDGGADGEVTLRENCRVFDDVLFRPRYAVATPNAISRTTRPRHDLRSPSSLAPVGSSRMFYPRGEVVAARAAGDAGTAYTLSTLSGCRVDEVGAGTKGPLWYQLYLVGGRDVATAGLERAMKAGATALCRHDRHGGGRTARARLPQRHQGTAHAQPVDDAALRAASSSPARAGSPASSATAAS